MLQMDETVLATCDRIQASLNRAYITVMSMEKLSFAPSNLLPVYLLTVLQLLIDQHKQNQ